MSALSLPNAQRLTGAVIPEHYALAFTPDLDSEQFEGEARVCVRVLEPTARFVLHAADLEIVSAGETRTFFDAHPVPGTQRVIAQTVEDM